MEGAQQTAAVGILAGQVHQFCEQHGTDEVAEVDHHQYLDHFDGRELAVDTAHDHQTVAGEQLAAHNHDHHQTHREDGTGHKTGNAYVGNGVHGQAAGRSAAGDEHACENTQQDHTQQGQLSFSLGSVHNGGHDLGRRRNCAVGGFHRKVSFFEINSVLYYRKTGKMGKNMNKL